MKRHQESHLDHGLTEPQIDYLLKRYEDRRAFFIETIELPSELGKVPCGLWGPAMGDPAILNGGEVLPLPPGDYLVSGNDVQLDVAKYRAHHHGLDMFTGAIQLGKRLPRTWDSRLIDLPMRLTSTVTVIAGPHEEHVCIIYTIYGGPQAPQEPTDPKITADKMSAAIEFWRQHALSKYAG